MRGAHENDELEEQEEMDLEADDLPVTSRRRAGSVTRPEPRADRYL